MYISPSIQSKAKQSKASIFSHAMNNLKFKGCGFNPSDQLLIDYLRHRTLFGCDYSVQYIIDLGHDICNYDPWDLPGCDSITPSDSVRFFKYPKTLKYPNSSPKIVDPATGTRPGGKREPLINRATKNGKWKISGVRIEVKDNDSKEVIGIKTRLYFKLNGFPNKTLCVLHQFELTGVDPCQNKYFLGKLIMKEFKSTDIGSSRGETSTHISIPKVPVEFNPEPLVEIEEPSDYDWNQNQTSEQTTEFITSVPVNDGNDVISNLQPSNDVADDAIPHNLQSYYLERIRSWLEEPDDIGDQVQLNSNQHDQSIQNIRIDNDQTSPKERSNQHSIVPVAENGSFQNVPTDNNQKNAEESSNQHNIGAVAENESINLPSNLLSDLSQINWSEFDDLSSNGLFFHELFDEAQNQRGINQHVADERDKSAAGAEIEGYNNLPFLGFTESSESAGKRSVMELERSSIDIEIESAQPQAKKSRL